MKLLELYADYFANWVSNGSMISRDKISLLGIRPLFDRYLTSKYITKVWQVIGFPVHYDKCLVQLIRNEMHDRFPEVKTFVHLYNEPVPINIQSDSYKRNLHSAANRYYRYDSYFQQLSDDEKLTGVSERDASGTKISLDNRTLQNIKDEYDSYMYVYDAANAEKEFFNTYLFVQASGTSKTQMQRYDRTLLKILTGQGLIVKKIRGNLSVYLENFGPATYKHTDTSRFNTVLMSQENIAAILPNKTRGLVGTQGMMLGKDWDTGLPFMLSFTDSDTAQVILICGKSGCGKTFLANEIVEQLIAFGIHCSIIDIKGGEWAKLLPFIIGGVEIDMSGDNARFVNLMRLDDLRCTPKDCVEAYESAISNTIGLFEVMTNLLPEEGNKSDLRSVLNQAVEKVFTTAGVIKTNPNTFHLTRSFRYENVLDVLGDLESSKGYTERQRNICHLVRSRCATYFMGEGRYSKAFQNEMTVADILEAPVVIYNFNKNAGEKLDIIDDIRVFMARCMDSRKHFIRKRAGLHQAAFYEELQRCGSMTTLIENISADVTGSRSNNLSVFLLLNAVSTFDSTPFAAIRSNITTAFIGKSNSKDIEKLVKEYDCGPIEQYMEDILENKDGEYDHCFAVMYDTGNDKDTLILKTVMPPEMSSKLSTRDHLKVG